MCQSHSFCLSCCFIAAISICPLVFIYLSIFSYMFRCLSIVPYVLLSILCFLCSSAYPLFPIFFCLSFVSLFSSVYPLIPMFFCLSFVSYVLLSILCFLCSSVYPLFPMFFCLSIVFCCSSVNPLSFFHGGLLSIHCLLMFCDCVLSGTNLQPL